MASEKDRVALVTGANKGIGFEIARQLGQSGVRVLLGARDAARGTHAVDQLVAEGLQASLVQIDVCDADSIRAAADGIRTDHGRLDILVNNAGISVPGDGPPDTVSADVVRKTFETNFLGAFAVTQAMLPLLRKAAAGRIINLSSSLGSLALNGDPTYSGYNVRMLGYNASKAALNMLTVQLAAALKDTGITVTSVCPGLTSTDLSNHAGDRSPAQGAAAPVAAALSSAQPHNGAFLDEHGRLPW